MNKSTSGLNSLFNRIFSSLSAEQRATFTAEQREALRKAFNQVGWKKHALDLRVSVPVPGRAGFYIVLLAGEERRSPDRILTQRRLFRQSLVLLSGVVVIGGLGLWASRALIPQALVLLDGDTHPVALPWIENEAECVGEGKFWQDGECWDTDHNPLF
jgi:hypothetical protein